MRATERGRAELDAAAELIAVAVLDVAALVLGSPWTGAHDRVHTARRGGVVGVGLAHEASRAASRAAASAPRL